MRASVSVFVGLSIVVRFLLIDSDLLEEDTICSALVVNFSVNCAVESVRHHQALRWSLKNAYEVLSPKFKSTSRFLA